MPELPEVETARRGIEPYLVGSRVYKVIVRQTRLRWPVEPGIKKKLVGSCVNRLARRGKYLLIHTSAGVLIMHLGMSGSLRITTPDTPPSAHDHFDLLFVRGQGDRRVLRFRDARRFGAILWADRFPLRHELLVSLGVEPLTRTFDGTYLYCRSRCRTTAVKQFIMNAKIVAGVGNIYANEALFLAGIHPLRRAGNISLTRYELLATSIREVLKRAIGEGGTTLKDFVKEDGRPGYFQVSLEVYGREGLACSRCGKSIVYRRIAQRSSFYCTNCQK